MKNTFTSLRWILATCFTLLVMQGAFATTLETIRFSSLPGDQTEILMTFDERPPEPASYTIDSPARISLDLQGVISGLSEKHHTLGNGNTRKVSVIQTKDRTRVIVNLSRLVAFETRIEGNTLAVLVGADSNSEATVNAGAVMDVSGATAGQSAESLVTSLIDNVDFNRGDNGAGQVIIKLSDPKAQLDVTSESGKIKVVVRNTELPVDLRRRLDVTDFATPVQIVDALQEGEHVVFLVKATGNYDYLAYQADDIFTVDVKPLTREEVALQEDIFKYKGEKLSLNFQDIEVRSVLQLIADFTDLNLVASDTVAGRITLRLKNVPWDQALDLILKTKGLDKREVGNVLLVAPAAEIAAREKLELENQRQISELAPLHTEFIQVRYANATSLFELFNNTEGPSILSDRGSVIVDERTNSVILTETAAKLEEFRKILLQLDVPIRQVLIESRIVTANANFSQQLGIRWGGFGTDSGNPTLHFSGSLDSVADLQTSTPLTFPDALGVDLGVQAPGASSIGIGIVGDDYILDLELSALGTEGHAEVIARPKVITSDKQTATIKSGVEIPYAEASSSGAATVSFKEAVLQLEVTPQITPDNRIIMDLIVNQDTVGQQFGGGGPPAINTNEIETQVLVENGQTIVLGGIFTTDKTKSTTKTPFFGDLPYVGVLFRKTTERDDKQELLVFITPRIIQDTLSPR
ncbi:MAG: type IV pilus secretin PilQ [Pseudomonadales bacterium]|nr:type IV pilus secretin PilQ [Pseudomonadales bacterium]